ncbi:hypothetical protein MKX01_039413, partial [Papaver californicum]
MCFVLFFDDINASSIHFKYLGLVETLETMKKVSWPDMIHGHLFNDIQENVNVPNVKGCVPYLLILFDENTKKGTIPLIQNMETILLRVGRWNVYEVSDFIYKTDMSQFT